LPPNKQGVSYGVLCFQHRKSEANPLKSIATGVIGEILFPKNSSEKATKKNGTGKPDPFLKL